MSSFQKTCGHLIIVSVGLNREAVDHTVPFIPRLRQSTVIFLLAAKDQRCVLFTAYIVPFLFWFLKFAFLLLNHLFLEDIH